MVGGPSRRFGSGQGTLLEVQQCSGDPPEGPEVVRGPIRRSENGRKTHTESESGCETFPKVQNWSGDAPEGPEVVGVPSLRSGSGR